jgi:hypothetical protein
MGGYATGNDAGRNSLGTTSSSFALDVLAGLLVPTGSSGIQNSGIVAAIQTDRGIHHRIHYASNEPTVWHATQVGNVVKPVETVFDVAAVGH